VDDDSDHADTMTIQGTWSSKSKTKTTVSWRLDLLKDKQIADLSGPDKDLKRGD
jgi:hypothetical protein